MEIVDYLILGHGYTAQYLVQNLPPDKKWVATSRTNKDFHYFDLADMESWDQLPKAKFTFWTFPPAPLDLVKNFFNENKKKLGTLVVVGSTSGFLTSEPHQLVDESTPLDDSIERAEAEKYLSDQWAILVIISVIYVPDKNPIDWVKNGYVGKRDKYVNMIHVEDLANIIFQASQKGEKGFTYIASDNLPLRWADVICLWEEKALVSEVAEKPSKRISKKINSSMTLKTLDIELKFKNFAEVVIRESL